MNEDLLEKVENFAFNNSDIDDIHGFNHVKRVYNLCIDLGKNLNANLLTLKISALLHDIGRKKENIKEDKTNHAIISAKMTEEFLKMYNISLTEIDLDNIIHCIITHSFSNKIKPKTIEAKILSDADKLDAIGAIGLYRTIAFTTLKEGGINKVIEHIENKIIKLKDQLYLDISKKIAKKRQKIIIQFYNEIKSEK